MKTPGRAIPMSKQWYIVHTYSGHEQKAMQALLERARALGKEDMFDEILIPEETVVEMVKGEKRTSKRKYFPGYIIVRMELTDETWHIVRGTPKITGFVGGEKKPPPISDEEVAQMTQQIQEGAAKPKPKISFDEGENVRVVSGPFANFSGYVDEVMEDKEKLRVMVHVFGRATPVVLDYGSVEKS
jgi:transcriptional antiterminator NusG